jgi:hypothetical protein
MMLQKRRRAFAFVALAASALLIGMTSVRAVHSTKDRTRVAKMTEKMKTVCVGRFLIDLPQSAEVSFSSAFVDGFRITTRAESADQFARRVAEREAEISSKPNELGRRNMESVKPVAANGFKGKAFIFGRWRTHSVEREKRVFSENVAMEGYIHANGQSVSLTTDGYAPDRTRNLGKLMAKFAMLSPTEIPAEPGFCIDRAFIRDPLTAEQNEGVTMFAGVPGHPDLAIAFSTMAGTTRGPGMLARNAAASARAPFYVRAAFTTLREGKRVINGLHGEELAMRVREANFTTGFSFDWEMGGRQDDVYAPLLTLELETGTNTRAGGKPVQSSLSEDALLDLWDTVSASIRLRPANPPKLASAEPVVPPLGTHASAGETCPQSGWWLCGAGGNGVGVMGGQRQYLRKGQRMPQALMLPPQTLWQKVRGLQPSYESDRPTAWKLVDKRSQARTQGKLPLVPAVAVARADATSPPSGAPPAENPSASIGTYVKTGAPCPASGWWRCEDSHSLDGTRWFAQGSLLPAATFQVPPGAFGRSMGRPEFIQRRSSWQLIRYAQSAEPANADAAPPTGASSPVSAAAASNGPVATAAPKTAV